MESPLLELENIEVALGGRNILDGVSLSILPGEQWAIIGASGSGKTVLAHTLAGKYFFRGSMRGAFDEPGSFQRQVLVVEQQHRFRDLRNRSDFYYQQRYNAQDASDSITVQEDLSACPDAAPRGLRKTTLIDLFRLHELLSEPLIQLSNGENKRLQIVKALLTRHALLILDQPFIGLDLQGRQLLAGILDQLSEAGEQMILITSARDIPSCFNRVAEMEAGRIVRRGQPADFQPATTAAPVHPKPFPAALTFRYPAFEYAVRMVNVQVRYEDRQILQGINWEVRSGSRWSLSGPNGAGKSTLLSLITGDNPQAYANEIYLFDRKRGTGESIWEIKQKTGFLSPELHVYFDRSATVYQALASGLWDTIGLFRRLSAEQDRLVLEWLRFLDLDAYRDHALGSLPAGLQRMALLGRAMIKRPPLLVLDEPCQGLDREHIEQVKSLIDHYMATFNATLIYVSHYPEEWPACIGHTLKLEKGRVS
jgi:molybdate transport system ATP-binding protein